MVIFQMRRTEWIADCYTIAFKYQNHLPGQSRNEATAETTWATSIQPLPTVNPHRFPHSPASKLVLPHYFTLSGSESHTDCVPMQT